MTEREQNQEEMSEFERLLGEDPAFSPSNLRRVVKSTTRSILEVKDREIIVDLNAKQDGIVRSEDLERLDDQFRDSLQVGDDVPCLYSESA